MMMELDCIYCGETLLNTFNGDLTISQIEIKQNHKRLCEEKPEVKAAIEDSERDK